MQPALAPAPHPSMQTSAQDHADQVLHDQLLAAQQHLNHPQAARPQPPQPQPPHMQHSTASPRDQNNIDPAISGAAMMSGPPQTPPDETSGPESPKSYGKRALSTSKRAAQNRAAQRAFRQRKETYIRKLEDQVKDFEHITENYKAMQSENYQLREYIINLQSRLLDTQGEVPEVPGNIDLSQPRTDMSSVAGGVGHVNASGAGHPSAGGQQQQHQHQQAAQNAVSSTNDDMNSLNRIAVAGLGMRKHANDETSYIPNNTFQSKRMRNDDSQPDGSDVTKTEPAHGLPVVS